MKAIIESNRHITVREFAKQLNVSHTTIENHIRRLGIDKIYIWVPHESKGVNLTQRINISNVMYIDLFLKRIITGDGKWIAYNNVNRKRVQSKRVQAWWTSTNHLKSWFASKEDHAVNLVGLKRCLCILSCFQTIKRSTQMFTANNLWNWRKQSKRKGQNWQIAKESYSTTTMRGLTHH